MFKHLIGVLLLAAGANAHADGNPWQQMAQADLEFAYQTIRANHPGVVDSENPGFRHWMEQGYAQARADAAKARSLIDMQILMHRYFAGFADGHLSLSYEVRPRSLRWAGLMVHRQGQRYRIVLSEDKGVPQGAELTSCDGRNIDTIINDDLAPQVFDNRQLDWLKTDLAGSVLTVEAPLLHAEYARCTFVADGKPFEHALAWRNIRSARYLALNEQLAPSMSKDSTITEVEPGHFWVRLPQFQPNDDQVRQIKELTARMETLRQARLVVFDIRGNNGGDSEWGTRVLDALYGKAYMRQQRRGEGYALWRASEGNVNYLRDELLPKLKRQYGADDSNFTFWSGLQGRLQQALSKGEPFTRQREAVQGAAAAPVPAAAPVAPLSRARIALVTMSGCASSCLDFADAALSVPGAVHLGETTGADTVYMDVRGVALPSGLGRFVVPMKVYRNRPRAHNAAYAPHLPYDGDIRDTKALQSWAMQQLADKPLATAGTSRDNQ